jgi:solute carrier family 25 folate transporter 32
MQPHTGQADAEQSNTEYILASGTSKLVAIALTYPYQVVRARIQNAGPAPLGASVPTSATSIASSATPLLPSATSQPRIPSQLYNTPTPTPNTPTSIKPTSPTKISIPAISRAIWRNEGLKGFYKGLGTNALRILPGTCTTFVVYENLVWGFRALALRREGGGVEDLR